MIAINTIIEVNRAEKAAIVFGSDRHCGMVHTKVKFSDMNVRVAERGTLDTAPKAFSSFPGRRVMLRLRSPIW
jgi:hypothetical protein